MRTELSELEGEEGDQVRIVFALDSPLGWKGCGGLGWLWMAVDGYSSAVTSDQIGI